MMGVANGNVQWEWEWRLYIAYPGWQSADACQREHPELLR